MAFLDDAKTLLSLAHAEGRVIKLRKLIQLEHESLGRPDRFLNRHAKIETRLQKYYAELEVAEKSFQDFIEKQ